MTPPNANVMARLSQMGESFFQSMGPNSNPDWANSGPFHLQVTPAMPVNRCGCAGNPGGSGGNLPSFPAHPSDIPPGIDHLCRLHAARMGAATFAVGAGPPVAAASRLPASARGCFNNRRLPQGDDGGVQRRGNQPDRPGHLARTAFAYGVLHAIGPGHGKAVIASYLLANENALKRGIGLAFAAAAVQALVALALSALSPAWRAARRAP